MAKRQTARCPCCGGPSTWEGNPNRPFCSERCRMTDLGNWAMEKYRIPDRRAGEEEMEQEVKKKRDEGTEN